MYRRSAYRKARVSPFRPVRRCTGPRLSLALALGDVALSLLGVSPSVFWPPYPYTIVLATIAWPYELPGSEPV